MVSLYQDISALTLVVVFGCMCLVWFSLHFGWLRLWVFGCVCLFGSALVVWLLLLAAFWFWSCAGLFLAAFCLVVSSGLVVLG